MHRSALIALYEHTQYRVRLANGGHATIRIGQQLPGALRDLLPLADAPWAFVTAWNPRSGTLAVRANRRRQRELLTALRTQRVTFRAAIGTSDVGDWCEPSLFVAGVSFARLDALMRPFDQHAIVRGNGPGTAELHWLE